MSNGNWWLVGVVGTIAAVGVGYYYTRLQRQAITQPPQRKPDLTVETEIPVDIAPKSDVARTVGATNTFTQADSFSELRTGLRDIREADLAGMTQTLDEVSYKLSEWLFYYDMRTKKSISWNPETGMINETTSPAEKDAGTRVARTMRKAYWDMHYDELSQGKPAPLLTRLEELQSRIQSFQPRNKKEPVFDLEYIRREGLGSRFDVSMFNRVVQACVLAMEALESPASHEITVKYFQNPASDSSPRRSMVDAISFLFSQLDVLETEVKNFKASQVQPVEKVKLEREAFLALVKDNHLGIHVIRDSVVGNLSELDRSSLAATDAAVVKNLKRILLAFIQTNSMDTVPESMFPSADMLGSFVSSTHRIVHLCAFLVCVDDQIGERGRRILSDLQKGTLVVSQLWDICQVHSPIQQMVDEVAAVLLSDLTTDITEWNFETISKTAEQCCSTSSRIYQLYKRRVHELLVSAVTNNQTDVAPTALGSKPWYMSLLTRKISELSSEILVFLASHMQVYRDVYRQLASIHSN